MCREHYTLVLRSSKRKYGTTTDYHIDCGEFFQNFNGRYLNGQLVSWLFPDDTTDNTNTADLSLQVKADLQLPYQTDTDNRGLNTIAVLPNNAGTDNCIFTTVPAHQFTCIIPNGNMLHIRIENASSEALGEDIEEHVLVLEFSPVSQN